MISITDHHIEEVDSPWLGEFPYRITITTTAPIRPRLFDGTFGDEAIWALAPQPDGETLIGWMAELPQLTDTLHVGYQDEPLIDTGL